MCTQKNLYDPSLYHHSMRRCNVYCTGATEIHKKRLILTYVKENLLTLYIYEESDDDV